ncbi:MAG: 4Fe-4S binding protein/FMN-binding protein [Clostridium sp.]|nr:4Fe-4S binding protein/FMN-binding protein [Clostridium sp.]
MLIMLKKNYSYGSKIKKIKIFRIVLQILFLLLFPGMFALVFSELKNIYLMIIRGNFDFIQAYPTLVEFITVAALTIILGRFFCGWICAFGTLNDIIHRIFRNVFNVSFKLDEKVDSILKYVKYIILLILIIFSWTMGSKFFETSNPWDAFARIISFQRVTSNLILEFIILLFIVIASIFIERFFCRYLCPLGAIFTLVSKISPFKINKPNEKCGKCRLCTDNCSMGLALYKVNNVHGGECINCLKCVEICPRKNIKTNMLNKNINSALISSVAIAGFSAVYFGNSVAGAAVNKNNVAVESSISASINKSKNNSLVNKSKYKDGVYIGNSSNTEPSSRVTVTIKSSKITDVKVEQTDGTPGYYDQAIKVIPNEIIKAQSTEVDVVSGATYSCQGIISGVKDALKQAK